MFLLGKVLRGFSQELVSGVESQDSRLSLPVRVMESLAWMHLSNLICKNGVTLRREFECLAHNMHYINIKLLLL